MNSQRERYEVIAAPSQHLPSTERREWGKRDVEEKNKYVLNGRLSWMGCIFYTPQRGMYRPRQRAED